MKTISEVSKESGVSVRTLQYYDKIGLLHPAEVTSAGYRLYDARSLRRLFSILLFRELDFPLAEIKRMLDAPSYDGDAALAEQTELLKGKRERLDRMIAFAGNLKTIGVKQLDFSIFSDEKQKEYAKQAKEKWGNTEAYREFERKDIKAEDMKNISVEMMSIFAALGALRGGSPESAEAQALAEKLRAFITANFYTCTKEIFAGLGQMYDAGGEMTENIDKAGGEGTAAFAARAIRCYCEK